MGAKQGYTREEILRAEGEILQAVQEGRLEYNQALLQAQCRAYKKKPFMQKGLKGFTVFMVGISIFSISWSYFSAGFVGLLTTIEPAGSCFLAIAFFQLVFWLLTSTRQ
jgi:hypothetical protein